MTYKELMLHYEYVMVEAGLAINVSGATVEKWKTAKNIPFVYQCAFEKVTNGALIARKEDDKDFIMLHSHVQRLKKPGVLKRSLQSA